MRYSRLRGFCVLLGVVAGLGVAQGAPAQEYPTRSVRSIVGFPPGGAVDFNARLIAQRLSELWGQPVTVENRGGAGSTIGAAEAAGAAPDGYTYLVVSPAHTINPSLYKSLSFDTKAAFAPVTQLNSSPLVLYLHPSVPANSVQELIALAKSKPGALNVGFGGNGTSVHLAAVLFNLLAGTNIVYVPYQGGGPTLNAILANEIQLTFGGIEYMTHVEAGKLKAIAVTSGQRSQRFSHLPTVAEAGVKDYAVEAWYGIYVPAKTPPAIVAKLSQDINKVLRLPAVQEQYAKTGFQMVGSTPEQFAAFTNAEIERWSKVVEFGKIKLE